MSETAQVDILARRGLKLSHLRLLAALAQQQPLGSAADEINITQPAASRLLAEIERIVGAKVHGRSGRGMQLTDVGAAMARRAQRVLIELRNAGREIESIVEGRVGTVRIGAVTGPAIERVLPALSQVRQTMPDLQVEVVVAPSDQLCDLLLGGQLDFAIGRLPDLNPQLFDFAPIAEEPVSFLVRRGHPLTKEEKLTAQQVMAYEWVMPGKESLLSRAVMAGLHRQGLHGIRQTLSTTSFLLTLALVERSEAIAPLASAVAHGFAAAENSAYELLDLDLGIVVETYGLVTLAESSLPPLAARIADLIVAPLTG